MDVELRLTRAIDQFSSSELQIAKNREGPVFVSRETENMFILTANLTGLGYKRGNIKIDINEAGNQITIAGEKQVQETIMVGIRVYKKDIVIKSFKKSFRIPDEVILDKIIAKFNDIDAVLTITMPKKFQGIRGYGIVEVNDQEIGKKSLETLQVADDESKEQRGLENAEGTRTGEQRENEELEREKSKGKEKVVEKQEVSEGFETGESSDSNPTTKQVGSYDDNQGHGKDEVGAGECQEGDGNFAKKGGAEEPEKKSLICAPIVAGSAILISLVVFVFHMIKNKTPSKKRD
ncbi:hypothetical protein Leryth_025384 [Lithospermum erythrorhizon]|nr:hypothetical protein Leryth_025384 [Lithospermum erythrorhizon]